MSTGKFFTVTQDAHGSVGVALRGLACHTIVYQLPQMNSLPSQKKKNMLLNCTAPSFIMFIISIFASLDVFSFGLMSGPSEI